MIDVYARYRAAISVRVAAGHRQGRWPAIQRAATGEPDRHARPGADHAHSFIGLGVGLVVAIVLAYLLIVVNFQSWLDPFIIITALPRRSRRDLLDAAAHPHHPERAVADRRHHVRGRGHREQHSDGLVCARAHERRDARRRRRSRPGIRRMRPVLMTALAMIIGMVPMAIGLGEGGEQNAPLGRAVIGGLLFATVATLLLRALRVLHDPWLARAPRAPRERAGAGGELMLWRPGGTR